MVLPKFLPAIVSPQASKIDMGSSSPFNGSASRRFLKNSRNDLSMRMDSLNDKGIYKGISTDSLSTERVFQYQAQQVKASPIMPEAQTAHDKLNLMIIRGQDPGSYIDHFNTSSAMITQASTTKIPASPQRPTLNDVKLKLGGTTEHPMHLQNSGYFTHRLSLAERGQRIRLNQIYEEQTHIVE